MKELHVDELSGEIGDHRGGHSAEGEAPHFEENAGLGLAGGFEPGQRAPDPQDEHDPKVQAESHPHDLVGAMAAVELRDEVGAQERDRIRQDADRERHGDGEARAGHLEAEIDEARDAEDVEHRQRSQEQPRQHQKHELTPFVHCRLIEPGQPFEVVLLRWKGLSVLSAHDPAF